MRFCGFQFHHKEKRAHPASFFACLAPCHLRIFELPSRSYLKSARSAVLPFVLRYLLSAITAHARTFGRAYFPRTEAARTPRGLRLQKRPAAANIATAGRATLIAARLNEGHFIYPFYFHRQPAEPARPLRSSF